MSKSAPSGLSYIGGEVNNVPARDLSADDLKRLSSDAWVKRRLAKDLPSLIDALLASGVYQLASDKE